MSQSLRIAESRDIAPFGETLRRRIDASIAVDKLNSILHGADVSRTQFDAVRYAIDKCLPTLQAIAVKITHEKSSSYADLESRSLELGINPEMLLAVPEKKEEVAQSPAEAPTPECDK